MYHNIATFPTRPYFPRVYRTLMVNFLQYFPKISLGKTIMHLTLIIIPRKCAIKML